MAEHQPTGNGHRLIDEGHNLAYGEFVARGKRGKKGKPGKVVYVQGTPFANNNNIVFGGGGGGVYPGVTIGEAAFGRPGRVIDAQPQPVPADAEPQPDPRIDQIMARLDQMDAAATQRAADAEQARQQAEQERIARQQEDVRRAAEQAAQQHLESLRNSGPEELRVRNPQEINVESLSDNEFGRVLKSDPMFLTFRQVAFTGGARLIPDQINSQSLSYFTRLRARNLDLSQMIAYGQGIPLLSRTLTENQAKAEQLRVVLAKAVVALHGKKPAHLGEWLGRQRNELNGINNTFLEEIDHELVGDPPRAKTQDEKLVDVGNFDTVWADRIRTLAGLGGQLDPNHPEYAQWYDFLSRSINLDELVKIGKEQWGEATPAVPVPPAPANPTPPAPAEQPNTKERVGQIQARLLEIEKKIKYDQSKRGRFRKILRRDADTVAGLITRRDEMRKELQAEKRKYRSKIDIAALKLRIQDHPVQNVAEKDHMLREEIAKIYAKNGLELEESLSKSEMKEIKENPLIAFKRCWTKHPWRWAIGTTVVNAAAGLAWGANPLVNPVLYAARVAYNTPGIEAVLHAREGSTKTKVKHVEKISDRNIHRLADTGAHIRANRRHEGVGAMTEAEKNVLNRYLYNGMLGEIEAVQMAKSDDEIKQIIGDVQSMHTLTRYDTQVECITDRDPHRMRRILLATGISAAVTLAGPFALHGAIDLVGLGIDKITHLPIPDLSHLSQVPTASAATPGIPHEVLNINDGFYDPTTHSIVPGNHPDVGLYVDSAPSIGVGPADVHQAIVTLPNGTSEQVLMFNNTHDYLQSTFGSHAVNFNGPDPITHGAISSGNGFDQGQTGDFMLHQNGTLGADQHFNPFEPSGAQLNQVRDAANANRSLWNQAFSVEQWTRDNLGTTRTLPFLNPGTISETIRHGGSYLTSNGAHVGDFVPVDVIGADDAGRDAVLGNVIAR